MNKNIFRAYDIRGNSKTDLDQATITKIGYVFPDRKHRWYQTTFSRLLSALLNKNELVRLSIIDVNKIPWEFAIPSVDEELTAIIKFMREKIKD